MTQEDKIFKTIISSSIKSVVRRYPYILMGEFMGTNPQQQSYMGSEGSTRAIRPEDPNPVMGVRILFTLDYEQVIEWDNTSYLYPALRDKLVGFPFRYLSTFTDSQRNPELSTELTEADSYITNVFYRNKYELDVDNKLGYLDYVIKYKVSDQKRYDTNMFSDNGEIVLPRFKYHFYKNYKY